MKIEKSINHFYESVQTLSDDQTRRLQGELQKFSSRYVKIDINNGTVSELDSAALRLEEIRRAQGFAGKHVFETKECARVLSERVTQTHPGVLRGMFSAFFSISKEPDIANICDENQARAIVQKFRNFFNDSQILGETSLPLSGGNQAWRISFKSDGIEIKKENIKEPLFAEEEAAAPPRVKDPAPEPRKAATVEETNAAIKIQKIARGYILRKAFLPRSLFPQYQKQYETVKTSPKAKNGDTAVYFPREMPSVVFKETGKESVLRFGQMLQVRKILSSIKSTHLTIPEARLYREFLVERRLPISQNPTWHMRTYCLKPELFDEVVREMTRFFSRVHLTDLVSSQKDFQNDVVGDTVRFDNIPLYIVEENGKRTGKIGLIDLEHIVLLNGTPHLGAFALTTLARIFPYHLDAIIDEAKKLGLRWLDPSVRAAAATGRKYYEEGYLNHYKWLQNQALKPHIEVAPERQNELKQAVAAELLLMNQGVTKLLERSDIDEEPPIDFLLERPEESAIQLAEYFTPLILKTLNKEIDAHVQKLGPESDVIQKRSVSLKNFEEQVLCSEIQSNVGILDKFIKKCDTSNIYFCNTMICAVLEKLTEKEIFAFNPCASTTSYLMTFRF